MNFLGVHTEVSALGIVSTFNFSHFNRRVLVSHGGFNLHFSSE